MTYDQAVNSQRMAKMTVVKVEKHTDHLLVFTADKNTHRFSLEDLPMFHPSLVKPALRVVS